MGKRVIIIKELDEFAHNETRKKIKIILDTLDKVLNRQNEKARKIFESELGKDNPKIDKFLQAQLKTGDKGHTEIRQVILEALNDQYALFCLGLASSEDRVFLESDSDDI